MTGALTGEVLADVRGGAAVDSRPPGQERDHVSLTAAVPGRARHHHMRAERATHHARQIRHIRPHERHLLHGREVEVDRLEQVAEGHRIAPRHRMQQAQHADRLLLVARLAGQRREPQQPERRARRARRDRRVLELLAPRDQLLVVGRRGEEAAALGVAEARDDRVRQRPRLGEPARLERRLVQREQRLEQEGVVLEVGAQLRPAVVERAQQPALGRRASTRARTTRRPAAAST